MPNLVAVGQNVDRSAGKLGLFATRFRDNSRPSEQTRFCRLPVTVIHTWQLFPRRIEILIEKRKLLVTPCTQRHRGRCCHRNFVKLVELKKNLTMDLSGFLWTLGVNRGILKICERFDTERSNYARWRKYGRDNYEIRHAPAKREGDAPTSETSSLPIMHANIICRRASVDLWTCGICGHLWVVYYCHVLSKEFQWDIIFLCWRACCSR